MIYTNREYELILEGYMKADGCFSTDHNRCVVVSTSLKLLMSIQAICLLLGYKACSIRKKYRSDKPIIIKGKEVQNVKDIYIMNIRQDGQDVKTEIKSAEDMGEQEVYNIGVDGSHTYICNNYKVHNCVDLIKEYLNVVFGIKAGSWGDAHAYYDNYSAHPELVKNFDRIANSASFVPRKGDIVIWAKSMGGTGHIAIATGEGNTSYFYSYDQNWGYAHEGVTRHRHDYNKFLGVLRPKNQALAQ